MCANWRRGSGQSLLLAEEALTLLTRARTREEWIDLGKWLRGLRESLGLPRTRAAEAIGCSIATLSNLERGQLNKDPWTPPAEPRDRLLVGIAETYGVELGEVCARFGREVPDVELDSGRLSRLTRLAQQEIDRGLDMLGLSQDDKDRVWRSIEDARGVDRQGKDIRT